MGIEVFPVPASGPSLAEITSAITTNAAPATVTMPAITSSITTNAAPASVTMAAITSSITTNAASSGVTMAAITSAITTNAASSGVTMAAINTAVANNASPYGGTITNLGVVSGAGTTTISFSSLSSYKYLKFFIAANTISSTTLRMRINGDTGSSYRYGTAIDRGGISSSQSLGLNTFIELDPSGVSNNQRYWTVEIPMSNSGAYKTYTAYGYCTTDTAAPGIGYSHGVWNSTAAISSVTFFTGTGNFDTANIYGIGAA